MLRWVRWLAFLVACAALAAPARADDVADEADLQFQLGAESYQRGDFRGALQHFLASNRLVANKNVLFNIARCYEKLTQYPEAYRYYTQALEGETDAAAIAKINAALGQLRANVAIIKVTSDPPGATLYVNRRDLGPRGNAPRTLGLSAGTYKIIGEFPGYEPASVDVPNVRVGSETPVALKLKPILGTVKVTGVPLKARVRVDDRLSKPVCTVPCELPLAPGRHVLFAEQDGYQTGEISVEVAAHRTRPVSVRLEPRVGSLVVSTDEPGALVEIDERPRGFTPAILPTPVGEHRVKVSLRGFRSIEQKVTIQQETEARLDLVLTQSEEVVAASRTAESVEDAPSSVSIVPRQEIRRLEYPTIAEAGRSVRGFYFSDDRSYVTLGSRGIGRLGSYGNRFLVLQDGQPTNDNWLGSSYLGYDALSDLGDVERIEFVRGPGSVLYGTSAFSGVINLITRDREVPPGVEMGVGTALDGVAHVRARGDIKFGKDAGMWTSISGARSRGRDFFFPQFVADTPPEIAGNARGVDGFNAGTLHGRAYFRDWNLQWFAHLHEKHIPTGEFDTTLGDGRTRQRDTRLFLEAKGEPEIARGLKLLSRLHLNHYRFDGYYARQPVDGGVEIDTFRGSWMGLEERLTWSPTPSVRVMAGGEGQLHFQVDQKVRDDSFGVSGYFLDGCGPTPGSKGCTYRVGAGYLVGDAALSETVRASLGARLDAYSTFGTSINPRAALIWHPYTDGNSKVIAGKAFRAPSIYELYYNDGGTTQIASPDLHPESIYSLELEHSHRFSRTVTGVLALFSNYVTDLVELREAPSDPTLIQYQNSPTPLVTTGAELGIRRDWRQGWMLGASYGFTHAQFLASGGASDLFVLKSNPAKRHAANAPQHSASVKGAVPLLARALTAATRLTLEDVRYDRFEDEDPTAEPQRRTDAAVVWDIVLSGEEKRFGLSYAFGVYDAFDWRYSLPVSPEFRQRTIEQNGRTFLASLGLAL